MKQKIVIKVSMNDQPSQSLMACFSGSNSRSKAMKIAAGLQGVEQAALGGREKDRIEVSGNGIDAVKLTNLLRKKVGDAELISVSTPAEEKKNEKKDCELAEAYRLFEPYGRSQDPMLSSQTHYTSPAIFSTIATNTSRGTSASLPMGNMLSLNASSQMPWKLSKGGGNYASWKSQMTNLLFGYGLLGFVDGSLPCPSQNDPRHIDWLRQDRLVILGIQTTVHSTISPTINNCASSADAWNKLATSYANCSNTRMLSILSSLISLKKEGKSVTEYMSRIRSFIDDLAIIGHPLNDAQIMSYTLNGLGNEFKELAAAVRVRDSPISFEDLHDKLLDEELLHTRGETKDEDMQITAQFTQRSRNGRGTYHGGQGGNRGYHNNISHPDDRTNGGQNFQSSQLQITNQHQPSYGRDMHSSHSLSSSPSWKSHASQGTLGQPRMICQICDKPGHSARTCHSLGQFSSASTRPQANIADGKSSHHNDNLVLDFGATHHISSDLQNLSMHSDYAGQDDVIVGNGSEYGGILDKRSEQTQPL